MAVVVAPAVVAAVSFQMELEMIGVLEELRAAAMEALVSTPDKVALVVAVQVSTVVVAAVAILAVVVEPIPSAAAAAARII